MPLLIFPASQPDIQLTELTFLCGETSDLRRSRVVTNCSGTITDNVRIITQTYIYFDITLGSQRFSNGTIKIWSVVMPQTPSQAWCCVGLHLLVKQHHLCVLEGVKLGLHVQDMTGSRCLLCVRNIRNITSMVGCGCFTVVHREAMSVK